MRASVILPASNEAKLIGDCLLAVLASEWPRDAALQVVVVANGCLDATADVARGYSNRFQARGWQLDVIERQAGGKLAALNAGDVAALAPLRIYLDADVTVDAGLLWSLVQALEVEHPCYASGAVRITAKGWFSRAYARIWRQVPFMRSGVPGCGVFAVNAAGRGRWGEFPAIISDDTFVRLSFAPEERIGVEPGYDWPIAEGFATLVKVRRRQDVGVEEVMARYPELQRNDDKSPFPMSEKLGIALRDPLGFAIYTSVAVMAKLTRSKTQDWSRSR